MWDSSSHRNKGLETLAVPSSFHDRLAGLSAWALEDSTEKFAALTLCTRRKHRSWRGMTDVRDQSIVMGRAVRLKTVQMICPRWSHEGQGRRPEERVCVNIHSKDCHHGAINLAKEVARMFRAGVSVQGDLVWETNTLVWIWCLYLRRAQIQPPKKVWAKQSEDAHSCPIWLGCLTSIEDIEAQIGSMATMIV